MRRAIAALAWLPDEDVEVPSAPDLEAPPVAAGEMVASPVADAASVGVATESTDVAARMRRRELPVLARWHRD